MSLLADGEPRRPRSAPSGHRRRPLGRSSLAALPRLPGRAAGGGAGERPRVGRGTRGGGRRRPAAQPVGRVRASRLTAAAPPSLASPAELVYLLQTSVPGHWIRSCRCATPKARARSCSSAGPSSRRTAPRGRSQRTACCSHPREPVVLPRGGGPAHRPQGAADPVGGPLARRHDVRVDISARRHGRRRGLERAAVRHRGAAGAVVQRAPAHRNNKDHILGAGDDARVTLGALLESL